MNILPLAKVQAAQRRHLHRRAKSVTREIAEVKARRALFTEAQASRLRIRLFEILDGIRRLEA